MKNYEYIECAVKQRLSSSRFNHTLNVVREAVKLALCYNQDQERCRLAALLHDMAKELSDKEIFDKCEEFGICPDAVQRETPQLLHGAIAARISGKEFEIEDEEILNAVEYHTTGRANMSSIEKIVYLADLIEEGRCFPGIEELREVAYKNIGDALLMSCNSTLEFIISRNFLIHPLTIEFRNDLLLKGGI